MNDMASHTFLWHDDETFGTSTRRDRLAQFAATHTDADLNEIGHEIMLYCQPAPDFLPEPEACLITGITPQHCMKHGIPEYQFAAQIEQAFSVPGTIGVGYNTIRFDDEITRFLFWRNLIAPYAHEWQQVFRAPEAPAETPEVEEDLYGGFLNQGDRRILNQLRTLPAQKLAQTSPRFDDARLPDLLLRYRARNFPQTLNPAEQVDEAGEQILGALFDYAEAIVPVQE